MIFEEKGIAGIYVIKPSIHGDNRGLFNRSLCLKELKKKDISFSVKQGNVSENYKKHTLRGFHYQEEPSQESKLLSCITGSIYNVVIDLRKNSRTYKKWISIEISANKRQSIYVAKGCANAFLTMAHNTIVHYYMGDFFKPESYKGFRYNDPKFKVEWPAKPKVISDKDMNFPNFEENQ